ncbi:MAG: HFLK protein [Oscillospiraceae bacterium]
MDDFGYFGNGIDGYVHYNQAFDRNFKGGGGGGNGGGGSGCLTAFLPILAICILAIITK